MKRRYSFTTTPLPFKLSFCYILIMLKEFTSLKPYFREHRHRYVFGVLFLFLTNAAQMGIPQIMKKTVNLIAAGHTDQSQILRWIFWMGLLAFLVAMGRIGWRHFIHGASRRIQRDLRLRLYEKLLTLSRDFYGRVKTGDIMARATNDMNHIRQATGMALVAFLDGLLMTLFILGILFRSYPRLTPLLILPLPLLSALFIGIGPRLGKLFQKVQQAFSGISDSTRENLSNIRLIKTFRRENYALKRFRIQNDTYISANLALVRIWGMFHPVILFLSGITTFLMLRYGGEQVLKDTLEPGDFVAIMSYMGMLIWPMIGAGFTINSLQRGAVSLGRINTILQEKPGISDPPEGLETSPRGNLVFEKLSFQFQDDGPVILKELDFTVPNGTTLGILGRTGSGKSTLVDLIPRLRDPQSGRVLIGGRDIRDYKLDALRQSFALVPQDSFLFSQTIGENIRFGCPEATDEEVKRVIEAASLGEDLKLFPKGEDTLVGEKGVTLSGGQKQRICLARALLMDRDFLILDDALSAVDTRTEEAILQSLRAYRKGKTTLLISHRYSTLQEADSILVLESGRKSDWGTHDQLISRPGLYRDIYQLQRLEEDQ